MSDGPVTKRARASPKGVLVLDYGSQYTQLITRRVREIGVYSVLVPGDVTKVRITLGPPLLHSPLNKIKQWK
jgi:GMP synthase (glutamine-hydrolysing)